MKITCVDNLVGYTQNMSVGFEFGGSNFKTNPSSGKEEDLNLGPPDYQSSALTTRHTRLLIKCFKLFIFCFREVSSRMTKEVSIL